MSHEAEIAVLQRKPLKPKSYTCKGHLVPSLEAMRQRFPLVKPKVTREKLINACARRARARHERRVKSD